MLLSSSLLNFVFCSKISFQIPPSPLPLPLLTSRLHSHNSNLLFSISSSRKPQNKPIRALNPSKVNPEEKQFKNEDEDLQVVVAIRSQYNEIVIVDTAESRLLLLDSTHSIHSSFNKDISNNWTNAYWDEFSSLPPIIPKGPIALYGLAGGTAAHLMLELWPSLEIDGWEIDEMLIHVSREYLGLSHLEERNSAGGVVNVRIGDALSPSSIVPGGYAGIIVDLFSEGKVLRELQEERIWVEMKEKLMPGGRIMVNCAGAGQGVGEDKVMDGDWVVNDTVKALWKAFPGELNWKKMPKIDGENYMAVTGTLPDLEMWSASVPGRLSSSVKQWRPFEGAFV